MFTAMNSQAAMYIDPATTSYIIQIGAGLLIALGTSLSVSSILIRILYEIAISRAMIEGFFV